MMNALFIIIHGDIMKYFAGLILSILFMGGFFAVLGCGAVVDESCTQDECSGDQIQKCDKERGVLGAPEACPGDQICKDNVCSNRE